MNKYYKKALETQHDRRPVFTDVIENYLSKIENPQILEIGCSRNLDENSIFGDGYSSIYWCDFLLKHGKGKLTIVEIDPNALENCKVILSDFIGKVDIEFICDDGLNGYTSKKFDLYFLDAGNAEWQTFEMFKKIDLRNGAVLIDDFNNGGKADRIKFYYPYFKNYQCNYIHCMGFYNKMQDYGNKSFKIGNLELDYYRGWRGNREASNNRAVEIALVDWFAKKHNNNIIEIGDVGAGYEIFQSWVTLDPYGPYSKSIRKDVLDYDYTGLNVVSVSTFEHFSEGAYNNNDKDKPIKALKKIAAEAKNYLITFDIGADRYFEDWLKNQSEFKYTFMIRDNKRGLINNWSQNENKDNFDLPYGHFDYCVDFYGNALAICVISNIIDGIN
jgi:hypothetical protein